ncbi:hypothetical protein GOP47_0019871 [Adiantum capillus-veneris]|uniref:Protein NEOXANTHIN-DEFICIENT 1 n=1 Tax=Adiantum capillus-veneris TaxID=13818 RepID=A0A9D4UDI4_ADICA|nr:hypothetical protein GOP47_0019871 [Adiantum capillus-veneris]
MAAIDKLLGFRSNQQMKYINAEHPIKLEEVDGAVHKPIQALGQEKEVVLRLGRPFVVQLPAIDLGLPTSHALHGLSPSWAIASSLIPARIRCLSEESSPYHAGPPWIFRGRAFYQLHLVKADVAKRFIPSDLHIVQAFGYTLGGLYLAEYDSSPAGTFNELVIIAGTVWNPPTSCAWAARVLVNSTEACNHGKKEVGLPSKVAVFSHVLKPIEKTKGWWRQWNPFSRLFLGQVEETVKRPAIDVIQMDGSSRRPLCQILFPFNRHSLKDKQWIGPTISMSLPSFSGKTYEQPDLLKYSCQLKCSVRAVKTADITTPLITESLEGVGQDHTYKSILAILAAKPILALCFEKMVMHVEAPVLVDANRTVSHTLTTKRVGAPVAVKAL